MEDARQSAFRLGGSIASVAAETERRQRAVRVVRASAVVGLVLACGTFGFRHLTEAQYSLIDCLYMTVITVSTVGFNEVIPTDTDALKWFTMSLILLGGGSIVYFLTSITAVVVEGDLAYRFWRQRMARQLSRLHGHVVLAGIGGTGMRALGELWHSQISVVVIEENPARIEAAFREFGQNLLFIVGDALDEDNLRAARLDRAAGLITSLQDDRENLFCCVTARPMNEKLRIVTKVVDNANIPKFLQVGATAVVNPSRMAARRLANELTRPGLMDFTDRMLASASSKKSLAALEVGLESEFVHQTLSQAGLNERFGCFVMGARRDADSDYEYPPSDDAMLIPGAGLVAMGTPRQLRRLRGALGRKATQ